MTPARKPWMKFYPADWQADEGLGQCSLAARGLWAELLWVMHRSPVYGHLLIAGDQPTEQELAKQFRCDLKLLKSSLQELEKRRVFSRTSEGRIYSRRMVKDAEKAVTDVENGRSGGNPRLKGGDNPPVNPDGNGSDKARASRVLEARGQKEERPPHASHDGPPKKSNRGFRLPGDWAPSASDVAFAQADGITDLSRVIDAFRDYYHSKTGARSTMLDWSAAWRNWCRNERNKPKATFRGNCFAQMQIDAQSEFDSKIVPIRERLQ